MATPNTVTTNASQKRSIWQRYWWVLLLAGGLSLMMCVVLSAGILVLSSLGSASDVPSKPTLPVTLTWRDSMVGQGRVLIVINNSDRHLHGVTIRLDAPSGENTTRTIGTIAPHEKQEIGWVELSPWVVESGETATLSHPDFRAVSMRIP